MATKILWDTETQEVHGGQTWSLLGDRFLEDFSVTTNAFGPPAPALDAAHRALALISHYPPADCSAALAALSSFTGFPASQMLLGNGASELIDLVMRAAPAGPFRAGPFPAAYMEYNRAATASGRAILPPNTTTPDAAVTVIIHPNSPTGDYTPLPVLDALIASTPGIVLIDESFIPFAGPNWHDESALSLIAKYPERLLVLNSWTKLWACPGLRLGSICAAPTWYRKLKKLQTPWSANTPAQEFLVAACGDKAYMERTWATLPGWRKEQEERIVQLGWNVNAVSPVWVPWAFVDCGGEDVARRAAEVAMEVGCPVRLCDTFGMPRFLRLGVRDPKYQEVLFQAWSKDPLCGAKRSKAL